MTKMQLQHHMDDAYRCWLTVAPAALQDDMVEVVRQDTLYRLHREILTDAEEKLPSLLPNELIDKRPDVELWNDAASWFTHYHNWMATSFNHLNAKRMDRKVDEFLAKNSAAVHSIRDKYAAADPAKFFPTHPVTISVDLQAVIIDLHAQMPFVVTLRHPGVRTRHWVEIEEIVGFDVRDQLDMAVADVLLMDFGGKKPEMFEVLKRAMAEYEIEYALDKMVSELEKLQFECIRHLAEGICEPNGVDNILTVIDKQFVAMQTMMLSPYVGPFKERSLEWIAYLRILNGFTDLLKECQTRFLYFLPVFSASEVALIIPIETARFVEIKEKFGKVIGSLDANSHLVHVLPARPELEILLQECIVLFDSLRGGIPTLLDAKRKEFSRLYFMSDRDLMDMMSKTANELHLLSGYVNKCFTGISRIVLNAGQDAIEAICNECGEQVFLAKHVMLAGLPVEIWMADLEKEMRSTLALITKQAVASVTDIKVDRRLFDWPVESTIVAHEVFFTAVTERAIGSGKVEVLRAAHDGVAQKINLFSRELRVLLGTDNLTASQRITRTTQLLLLLKFRDNLSELICNSVTRLDDFVWTQNLRYYYKGSDECVTKCAMYSHPYGFEYLGGKARLVMTDATKRAVGTMLGALHYNLGSAVIGQPGCGKSQTSADVAAALGRPFISFNCEEAFAPDMLTNFLRGVAATAGAWICLDNFNMLSYATMSAVAQQVLNIQRAASAGKKTVLIDEVAVPLRGSSSITVSLDSHSWADGSVQDNVKAMFRPVAILLPSYRSVCEARLVSAGFHCAADLATKLDCCFHMLSHHLSKQSQYNFGVWSVMAVLKQAVMLRNAVLTRNAAAAVAAAEAAAAEAAAAAATAAAAAATAAAAGFTFAPVSGRAVDASDAIDAGNADASIADNSMLEFKYLIQAIDDCIKPGLCESDVAVYTTIIAEVFAFSAGRDDDDAGSVDDLVKRAVDALQGLSLTPTLLRDALHLYNLQTTRLGVVLLGETGCGKTTCYRVVHKMLELQGVECELNTINPKAISRDAFCGIYNTAADRWDDGIFTKLLYRHINRHLEGGTSQQWIVIDGTLQGDWTDGFMSVLDETRTLCLTNGERVRLAPDTSIMFEVTALAGAIPSLITRCAIAYFQPTEVKSSSAAKVLTWLANKDLPTPHKVVLENKVEGIFEDAVEFASDLSCPIAVVGSGYADSFISILEGLLLKYPAVVEDGPLQQIKQNMEVLFAFAVVWAFGANLSPESRFKFDNFFVDALGAMSLAIPEDWSVFDVWFDFDFREWKQWSDATDYFAGPVQTSLERVGALIVPTADTNYVAYLSNLLNLANRPLLVCGEDAIGKSTCLVEGLRSDKDRVWARIPLCWSAHAEMVQRAVERKLERKQKANASTASIFGPIAHGSSLTVIVEDLHVPEPDLSGARSPNEYLRQLLDYGGCYHMEELEWCSYNNVHINATQGVGGETVSARLTRHFTILHCPPPTEATLEGIFTTCLNSSWVMSEEMEQLASGPLIKATVKVYTEIRHSIVQDGSPECQHYRFGMYNIANMLRSIMSVPEASQPTSPAAMVKLWVHELTRSFRDRLARNEDRAIFDRKLLRATETCIKPKYINDIMQLDR